MSVQMTITLPAVMAERLETLATETRLTKDDLVLEGLRTLFAARLDRTVALVTEEQLAAVLNILDTPTPPDVTDRIRKTLTTPYAWEEK